MLLDFLHQRELQLEEVGEEKRLKLEEFIQYCMFEQDAKQVLQWIKNGDVMLTAGYVCPTSLSDAEGLQKEFDKLHSAIKKTHQSAQELTNKAELLINQEHFK